MTLFSLEINVPSPRSFICNAVPVCFLKPPASYVFQMLWAGRQAGIGTKTTVLRGLYHPATVFMGHHTSAVVATGGLGMRQDPPQPTESCSVPDSPWCSPSLEGLGPESRSADLQTNASAEGAARRGDLPASEEGSEQLISSTSDPKAATSEEEQPRRSVSGKVGWVPVHLCLVLGCVIPTRAMP